MFEYKAIDSSRNGDRLVTLALAERRSDTVQQHCIFVCVNYWSACEFPSPYTPHFLVSNGLGGSPVEQ